jgi:hypothetical protein
MPRGGSTLLRSYWRKVPHNRPMSAFSVKQSMMDGALRKRSRGSLQFLGVVLALMIVSISRLISENGISMVQWSPALDTHQPAIEVAHFCFATSPRTSETRYIRSGGSRAAIHENLSISKVSALRGSRNPTVNAGITACSEYNGCPFNLTSFANGNNARRSCDRCRVDLGYICFLSRT